MMDSIYFTEEHMLLQKTVRDFSKNELAPLAQDIDSNSRFPSESIKKISKLGLMGIPWDEKYGGGGMDTLSLVIVINEIAPRVHNSGHHTLQSSKTSQFEQHLRAILGLELGSTELSHNAIMYNILGSLDFEGEYKKVEISKNNIFLKMYEKKISKPLRKLGHLNIIGSNNQTIDQLLDELSQIKDKVEVKSI